jgi:hypothetical protein
MRKLLLGLVVAVSACVVRAAPPPRAVVQASGWAFLGKRWVNGRADHDVIHVGARDGRFHQIQIVVDHSALELFDLAIVFGDGEVYAPPTRLVFAPGTTTRVIDLPGGARVIRRIEFRYGNLPGGGRAHVQVYGA